MLNVTRWRIAYHFRSKLPTREGSVDTNANSDRTATPERVPDPANLDEVWEQEWKKNMLETALTRLRRRVNPKHAQIFDLYAMRGWPATRVAGDLGVNIFHVYLVGHRLTISRAFESAKRGTFETGVAQAASATAPHRFSTSVTLAAGLARWVRSGL
jgi:hypothetical protein